MAMKNMIMIVMMVIIVVSLIYAIMGIGMHAQVVKEEAKFHFLQDKYWNVDKTTRDAAPANSALTSQLVDIKNFPSDLTRLKLVGVGRILIGIYVLLFGILIALMMMPKRLGDIIKRR